MIYAELKEKRKQYHISQTKIAEASGFSKSTISSWELGKRIPTQEEIAKADEVLTKMIHDIQTCVFDVRKKRITHSKREKHPLPPIIKSPDDYRKRMSHRKLEMENPYRKELDRLYERAQLPGKRKSPKALALFSGCGGLSLGFAAEGFRFVGHVEIESSANEIYKNNFPNSSLLGRDICDISDEDMRGWIQRYGEIDVIVGGPPCQGFSLAGKRDPKDARNRLYAYYAHMVSILRPKIFVMENVRLLTSMKMPDGQLFVDGMVQSFSDSGYRITKHEVNACDYGVPQSRERVILVGVREDLNREFVLSEECADKNEKDIILGLKKRLTFRDATLDLEQLESGESSSDPLHFSIAHPEHVIAWLKDVPEGRSAHENENPALRPPSGFNTTYKRNVWDEPCSTISTNFSMISGCKNVHPTSTRSLTIREAARVQSFPDAFVFTGKWGDVRKAIGNAVPPILASKIAKEIRNQFFSCEI